MKSILVVVLLVGVCFSVSAAYITAEQGDSQNAIAPIQRQQFDLYASSRRLIEQLIESLRNAARDAYDAVARFTANIQENAKAVRDRIVSDIQKLRNRVGSAIETVRNRLIDSGVGIVDCVASHNGDANAIFNDTLTKTVTCVDERIAEVSEQISNLRTLASTAVEFGNNAMEDMKKCTADGGTMLAMGSCLGSLSVQAEIRALVFATQSALSMGRINLSLATLPASLEVCAGSRLVDAGMTTARLLMEIGTCSASSVLSTMTGNVEFQTDNF